MNDASLHAFAVLCNELPRQYLDNTAYLRRVFTAYDNDEGYPDELDEEENP